MRRIRCSVAVFCWLGAMGLAPMAAQAQQKGYAPADLLAYKPALTGVDYDTPTDQKAIDACKVELVTVQNRSIGYALRDGQGKMLRRFIAFRSRTMDQWSYYQDGFEVYRESDLDGDRALDEARWMNAGGSRIAMVKKGKIVAWKQISAEEASKVFVQGLVQAIGGGDASLLETVMATPEELAAAGLPRDVVDKVAAASASRGEKVGALVKSLNGWTRQTVWNRFDGTYPHVIPADPAGGPEKDIVVYENAMIFPGTAAAQANAGAPPAQVAFLQIPDMIKLGETWKFIELPRAIDPEKPVIAQVSGIRALLFDRAPNVQPRDEAVDTALKALADYDGKNANLMQGGGPRDRAQYYTGRVRYLRAVVSALKSEEEKLIYDKQVVDCLVEALRTGAYAQGRESLEKVAARGGKLGSYSAYRLINVDFAMKNDENPANVLANQKAWMADLQGFLTKYAGADEVPDALLQLASANEFNGEEDEASKQYAKVVQDHPRTDAAKKAAGSLRRLGLVGKALALKGSGLQNEVIDASQYRGKAVLVVFWASWATPFKSELPDLKKIAEKYRDRGLEVIGVNLDNERAEVDTFLKENPLAWPQIFEGGGLEGRLAVEYGITSVPTMFLADAQGKVINRNIRTSAEAGRQIEKLLGSAQKDARGVALDQRQ
jgi:thiol-disulfide isomerase/thioredoxin